MPDPAQPAAPAEQNAGGEGQGTDQAAGGLYDLTSVPEELRPHIEPHLKAIEGNVTRKFQDYSEQVKAWEPYASLGINEIDPEVLGELLEFAKMSQDQDAFAEWWKSVGEELKLFPSEDPEGSFADDELGDEGLTAERIAELVAEQVKAQVEPLQERFVEQDQQQAEQQTMAEIKAKLDEIKGEDEDVDGDAVLRLALAYAEEDPENCIDRGYEDYKRLVSKGEAGLFAEKNGQPPPVEGNGSADTSAPVIKTFEEAKAAGLERLKALNAG